MVIRLIIGSRPPPLNIAQEHGASTLLIRSTRRDYNLRAKVQNVRGSPAELLGRLF